MSRLGRVILTIKNVASGAQSIMATDERDYTVLSYQFTMFAGEMHSPMKDGLMPSSMVPTVGDRWLECK